MRRNVRSLATLALTVAVLVYPTTALAEEATGTAAEGVVAGQADGRSSSSGFLWFGAGCLFTYFGVGAAYLITPSPPAMRLLGKSIEYVAAYTDAYAASARSVQTNNAWWGCILTNTVGCGLYVVFYALMMAAYASQIQ
jgi:hypothetical protein